MWKNSFLSDQKIKIVLSFKANISGIKIGKIRPKMYSHFLIRFLGNRFKIKTNSSL
ncbi:hypothetical protein LEP1GSC172_0511 [Leptospira noguchii]|uniref:Uncharacterized protein n=2 Tax=Leptospira noguchii TaxID=28182 RepID=T0GQ83_9LEPT|nr:hypothetical protein LEP1GSC172_0511 [Leptospira noguchii]EQA71052.1 hypothetical protein LEP1GSC059_3148 [Leptospira noguchii serovar Panama str. CZ214]